MSDSNLGGRAASLAADLRRKRGELEDQHKELTMLVKQTAQELDRATQRAREAVAQIRQVESNFGNMPQADVKRAYGTVQEAQMRQFMMQTQLDQQRGRLAGLDSTDELLRQLIETADELAEGAEMETEPRPSASAASQAPREGHDRESAQFSFRSVELALQRASRQVQDETAQTLSDLILRAEVCERLLEMDKQKAKTELSALKHAASTTLRSTRHLVQELRAPALEEAGLAAALRRYAESLKTADKLHVDLEIAGIEEPLPRPVEIAAFRVIQEALTNAAAHSQSGKADVRVRLNRDQLVVTVADEGVGFDVEVARLAARAREHSGIAEMEQRALIVGGELEISSAPGSGCTVRLTIPV